MTKAPISLQDLSLYVKAKAEPSWHSWGLYVHVCKMETLRGCGHMNRAICGTIISSNIKHSAGAASRSIWQAVECQAGLLKAQDAAVQSQHQLGCNQPTFA